LCFKSEEIADERKPNENVYIRLMPARTCRNVKFVNCGRMRDARCGGERWSFICFSVFNPCPIRRAGLIEFSATSLFFRSANRSHHWLMESSSPPFDHLLMSVYPGRCSEENHLVALLGSFVNQLAAWPLLIVRSFWYTICSTGFNHDP
jgi:hypothetical protein